ncbi:hypothetical protein CSKR_106229 [Clonorchis sinensis]|uniref:Uncharacterized protein n=1 Tax=Clonorchis sinensis TaxID=79923 RepID=A0A419PST6_CLOSI|nr:hypothetical protein CSKR_106229 [Clonorchis sinensis]
MPTPKNELLRLISAATVESFWTAFDRVNEQHGLICDERTGNTPLHFLVLSLPKLVRRSTVDLKQSTSQPDVITDETSCAPWISPAVALLYRLAVLGNVPVNAQNSQGNTAMHLSCIQPHAEVLQVHLIRLGADPLLENRYGARVYYNPQTKRGHLVKGLPSLQCGIWDAIRREDTDCVQKYLRAWSRTVVINSEGQSLLDFAAATGSDEIHRRITEAQATSELVAHSMALDTEKMLRFLTSRREKEKCDLFTCDQSFDPPRPLIAELRLTYGQRAEEVIQLLASYGMPDEHSYLDQIQLEHDAFDVCPFVLAVTNAKSLEDLDKAWLLLGDNEFNVRNRRSKDGASYLHFLVERYFASSDKPLFQRKLVRLMFRLALVGLDVQARDHHGRTALVLAAERYGNPCNEKHDANQGGDCSKCSTKTSHRGSLVKHEGGVSPLQNVPVQKNQDEVPYSNGSTASTEMTTQLEWSTKSLLGSSVEKCSAKPADVHSTIPDQHLLEMLLQLGIDSSIGNLKHQCLQKECFVPRDALTIRARNSSEAQQNTKCLPGAWPLIDMLIRAVSQNKPKEQVSYLLEELESSIRDHLVRVQVRRNGLTLLELARAMLPKGVQKQRRKQSKGITTQASNAQISAAQHLVDLLQRYTGTTEFAMAAMAGDTKRMRHCLAMGNGTQKLNASLENYFESVSNNLRASFVKRPLILNVMEYSSPEAAGLMLKAGANVREFYPAPNSHGPLVFWAFNEFINLETTMEVAKHGPIDLRDINGSTMLHHAVNIFHQLHKGDRNGRMWVSLIVLTLLNRGIKLGLRDSWGRTARDLATGASDQIGDESRGCQVKVTYREPAEEPPNMDALHEIIDRDTQEPLSLVEIIDRHVVRLCRFNQLHLIEELIIQGYEPIQNALLRFPHPRTSLQLAELHQHVELAKLLSRAPKYQEAMKALQEAVVSGDELRFASLVNEWCLLWCVDWRGRSLLHLAVIHRQNKLALQLIDMCPSLANNQDSLGRTPMHYAICLGDGRELFLKLVARMGGVDKTIKDFQNVSIGSYGDQFEKGVEKYRNLVRQECELRPPAPPLQTTANSPKPPEREGTQHVVSWPVDVPTVEKDTLLDSKLKEWIRQMGAYSHKIITKDSG